MARKSIALSIIALVASFLIGCDKAPSGVIPEGDMAHVLADFAKADALISQYPDKFPDDSSKMALKQSILKKYDADLAMYDSSLVWYAHNLKLYSELHDKAVVILEKEGNIKHDESTGNQWATNTPPPSSAQTNGTKRVYPTNGDSANIWKEPQQWILTSAMRNGYIKFDYKPDSESRQGDLYSLNFKMMNSSGNTVKILLAIDYHNGTTSYINRTANVYGWSNYDIQSDKERAIKRIYGYIYYNIKPQRVTFIDSIYLLRTHHDPDKYHIFNIQRIAGPKSVLAKDSARMSAPTPSNPSMPGRPSVTPVPQQGAPVQRQGDSTFRPKPRLNKSVIPSRERISNPNGEHIPHPPIR